MFSNFNSLTKKIVLISFLSVAGFSIGFAQQDPQFSQNMHNKLFINPGVAGSNNAICGTLFARQQWMGFNGKPQTYLLSAHMPLSMITNLPIGAGLSVYSDKLGQMSYTGFKFAGAYRKALGNTGGTLGLGLSLGMVNLNVGNNWVALDGIALDNSISAAAVSKASFDMDLGVYYEIQNKLYVGLSVMHLPSSTLKEAVAGSTDVFNYKVARHYYIMAGYHHDFDNSPFALEPSVFIKTDGSSAQMDFNALLYWNNQFWVGASYRLEDAIAPMLGVKGKAGPKNKYQWKVGYAYDVTTSELKNHSSGSHELMLGFCYDLSEDGAKEKNKSIRFFGK